MSVKKLSQTEKAFIYKIVSPNGKVYIGSTLNYKSRINQYKRLHEISQTKLYNSLITYGVNNHIYEIIEECDIKYRYEKEHIYGLYYNVIDDGLNSVLPKYGNVKALYSKDTLLNRSLAQIGKKASLDVRKKMSISQTGRKHSLETRDMMRKSSPQLKLIINLQTGIYYYGTNEASKAHNMNKNTLKNKLNGSKINNTNLIYV
jgi:group I intron endonuclease